MLCCSFMPKWRWRWNWRGGTRNRRLRSRWCSWCRWYRWSRAHWWDIKIDIYPRNIGILIFIPPVAKGVKTDISTCAAGHVSCLLLNVWGWLTLGDFKKMSLYWFILPSKGWEGVCVVLLCIWIYRVFMTTSNGKIWQRAMWCIFSHCKYGQCGLVMSCSYIIISHMCLQSPPQIHLKALYHWTPLLQKTQVKVQPSFSIHQFISQVSYFSLILHWWLLISMEV